MRKIVGLGSTVKVRNFSSISGELLIPAEGEIVRMFLDKEYLLPDGGIAENVWCYELDNGLVVAAQDVIVQGVQ